MISKILFGFCTLAITSCISTQNQAQNVETNTPAEIEAAKKAGEEMMAAGYLPGRIIYSDEADDCQYTIQLKDGDRHFYYVDPVNLDAKFNTDGQTVWLKFTEFAIENRCQKAIPVEILEILNRDE